MAKQVKKRKKFTWIKREIELSKKQVERIKLLKTISIENRSSRFYPNHELLAQTLGFVGIDNDGLGGLNINLMISSKVNLRFTNTLRMQKEDQ